jgi:hypothetical protein
MCSQGPNLERIAQAQAQFVDPCNRDRQPSSTAEIGSPHRTFLETYVRADINEPAPSAHTTKRTTQHTYACLSVHAQVSHLYSNIPDPFPAFFIPCPPPRVYKAAPPSSLDDVALRARRASPSMTKQTTRSQDDHERHGLLKYGVIMLACIPSARDACEHDYSVFQHCMQLFRKYAQSQTAARSITNEAM